MNCLRIAATTMKRNIVLLIVSSVLLFTLTGVLQAQQFEQIPALSFMMPLGGGNPLPQILMVASTGTNFNYTASTSTSQGGNWLSVSPGGNCCTTPSVETVSVSNTGSLTVGTYNGQVTFKSNDGSNTLTIPVTLTVAATNTAFFDSVPSQLSFSMQTGGKVPPAQTFIVHNGGVGTLNWTVTASTADGGAWLTPSPKNGTAPSEVTAKIVLNKLPGGGTQAGRFDGQLLFHSSTGDVTVPVSMTVDANAFPQLNPISFTMPLNGGNPLPQVLLVASTGLNFNYTAVSATSQGGNWLSVSPGGNCCTTPSVETVSVSNTASLPAGSYGGEVTLRANDGTKAITVPVSLTVAATNTAFFDSVPSQLSFSMQTNGAAPPAQAFIIHNGGVGTLNWTVTTSTADGGAWLSISANSGTAPTEVTAEIAPGHLPNGGTTAGRFDGQFLFHSSAGDVTVPVSVTVDPDAFWQINPISFTMPLNGGNPLPQVLVAASTGVNFNYTAVSATSQGGNWLSVSPGGNCCTTPSVETVSVSNAGSLPAGSYSGEVTFRANDGTKAITVPVTLTVAPINIAFFDSMPSQLSFSMPVNGVPPAQTFIIHNDGVGTLNWTVTTSTADGGEWLSLSSGSGTAPTEVTAEITPSQLPNGGTLAGRFDGQFLFHSSAGDVTVPVSVTVDPNAFRQLNPISFTMPAGGGNPLPQVLLAASTGVNFNYTAASATSQGGNWLSVSPGGNCCTTPSVETVSVSNTASLPAGSYGGEVTFRANDGTKAITVPVTLTVAATNTAFFDSVPGQLSFSMQTNGAPPPAQVFTIRNGGQKKLNWTLTTSTSDGNDWLKATPEEGTAPKNVTVKIVPASLPDGGTLPGRFDGQLLFHSSAGDLTVPVSVTVDANAFLQINPISFTMPSGGNNPLPQLMLVASTGVNFNYTASSSTAKGGNWLSVSPGGNCCTTPSVETVSVSNTASLPAGSYSGQLTFRANDGTKAITVLVTLTVEPATKAFFDNLPGQTSFSFTPSSQGNPPSQIVPIGNGGSGTLNWTLTKSTADGRPWLKVTPVKGVAPSVVTVTIIRKKLSNKGQIPGSFVGQQVFQTASGNVTVPVNITIGDSVFVPLDAVTFTTTQGVNPSPQHVTVSSTGTNFNYTASAASSKGGNWLSVSPGGNCCTTPQLETVSVNATALGVGTYIGQLTFRANDGTEAMTVPVILTVNP